MRVMYGIHGVCYAAHDIKCWVRGADWPQIVRLLPDYEELTMSTMRAGGAQVLSVLLTVALVCGVLGVVGYGVYQFRIRSAMHQEIRAIMRQYMPLQVWPLSLTSTTAV